MDDIELPPILPDIEDELKQYILCPEKLPIHQYELNQEFWPRNPDPKELLYFEGSPLSTTLKVQRDPNTGEIKEFREVPIDAAGATARNSMSLNRAPALPSEATRGNASYIPFWPGSFPDPSLDLPKSDFIDTELLTVAPGFKRGLVFDEDGRTLISEPNSDKKALEKSENNIVSLMEIIQREQDFLESLEVKEESEEAKTDNIEHKSIPLEDEIIPKGAPVLSISSLPPPNTLKGSEWAILLDASKPVKDFNERIPEMAKKFEFELDTFQKLAILQLEQHNHVFVAAHTSAGKTVVAEYAIALSQKHMTRTIYTSPIKALSNQKYRDFKREFKDVGLITGDFQINQTASCLIMTTEILRSMLYCGSDITRDLEYVIFDEVHYINDRERGHVWEQVLILLPAHVCVVLLSATVPNIIEFGDWLGRTHQRKVYVVTTSQRPVPLKHYLYTGRGGGSRHNRFLILDSTGWQMAGYVKSKDSLHSDQYKNSNTRLNPTQEKTLWTGLVDHLKKNDLLPVVAFTFSRQKCDNNAMNLTNLDLTTQKEKAQINMFFNKCIRCLKEPDQEIPQIINMRDILLRGVGVHHSGILPIIKEIVEMLFQRGLIKLLFATETFAMGVNMPARTVVFDSVKKHDGVELRDLHPAEYIQMAGRAGRRGLDKEGTVIILCKLYMPPDGSLKEMMLGKPNKLVSQFRLTYGMVLSLLRVETLTVEAMMSRSFREADHQKCFADIKKELEETAKKLEEIWRQQLSSYLKPLVKFYESASAYLDLHKEIMPVVVASPKIQKVLTPGRILQITQKPHVKKLALLLSSVRAKVPTYKVLVLTDSTTEKTELSSENRKNNEISKNDEICRNELWYQMLGLAQEKLFIPISNPSHDILTVSSLDIFEISAKSMKINTELVLNNWEKRQMERFKYDPPGQTCLQAVQELQKLTMLANDSDRSSNKIEYSHFVIDLKVNEQHLYHKLTSLYDLKDKLIDHLPSTQIPNFEQHFATVFTRKFLEDKKKSLEFKLSNASLALYPDYQNRIELLRQLEYVNTQSRVLLKGRVACEMGMNEILITELVSRNILTKLEPEEVAALLSAIVYRVRKLDSADENDEELTKNLREGIRNMKQVHQEVANLEIGLHIQSDDFQQDLNFGLVHVVYSWATGKPFAEIMDLTDTQEGIIVRAIQQLNETIMDVRDAAKIIGNPELQSKMEKASTAIKRDIVFAASLYTHDETF